jgi:uncharacterized protein (UPF0332 family)
MFLEVATRILGDKRFRDEASWRTAIGRAYYAAFLKTKEKLEHGGLKFTDVDTIHQQVINGVMERDTNLGDMLDLLRQKRVDADYYMSKTISKELAGRCATISEKVINSAMERTVTD